MPKPSEDLSVRFGDEHEHLIGLESRSADVEAVRRSAATRRELNRCST